ncbi:MAG: hypothetical protein ACJARM_002922 [Glaciecola sp.]|jgi:hypothetical protein
MDVFWNDVDCRFAMKGKAHQAQSITDLLVDKSVLVESTTSIVCLHKIAGRL